MILSKLKFTHWVIIGLIILSGYQYYKNTLAIQENLNLKLEKKDAIKKVRDSAFAQINEITIKSKNRFDSIANIPPKIKWYPYEKPIYINRSLNDAINIINDYKYIDK